MDDRNTWIGSRIRTVDAPRLNFGHGVLIKPANLVDLGEYAAARGLGSKLDSLASLYLEATGTVLAKDAVRVSRWHAPKLTFNQLRYAAMDVMAALTIKRQADIRAIQRQSMADDVEAARLLQHQLSQSA